MASIRRELVNAAKSKAISLINHFDIDKEYELRKQAILTDKSLTSDEKSEVIRSLTRIYDHSKVTLSEGIRRVCENCKQECLATLFCELCVRNYLKANFSNWTSGNDEIDNLIKKYQMETLIPHTVIEWIPYNNLRNVKYLTRGGCSEIYTADWIGGWYHRWDSNKQQLERLGTEKVILKRLTNIESANRSWFEEVCQFKIIIKKQ